MELNNEQKSLLGSASGMLIAFYNSVSDEKMSKTRQDDKEMVEDLIMEMVENVAVDKDSWPHLEGSRKMLYDIYLDWRKSEGKLTDTDLTRGGMTVSMFTTSTAWHEHCVRVAQARAMDKPSSFNETKECSSCGQIKPRSKFKKNGGSKCNACMCADYRKRRAER